MRDDNTPVLKLEDLQLKESDIRRFWSKVDKTPGFGPWQDCWQWLGTYNRPAAHPHAYGVITTRRDGKKSVHYAHRLAFMLAGGEIKEGQVVMHRCDTPKCARASHLFVGQPFENMHDKWARGRSSYGGQLPITCVVTLAKIAHARGFTQQSLVEASGVPLSTIQGMWQNRVIHLDMGVLSRLAAVLDVEPGALLGKAA